MIHAGPVPKSGARQRLTGHLRHRWSGVDRAERARRRAGEDGALSATDEDSPLPHVIDPITLEPVVTPAMSPAGHVMGLATWTAVLAEQGKCPFTQQPLRRDQVTPVLNSVVRAFKLTSCVKSCKMPLLTWYGAAADHSIDQEQYQPLP